LKYVSSTAETGLVKRFRSIEERPELPAKTFSFDRTNLAKNAIASHEAFMTKKNKNRAAMAAGAIGSAAIAAALLYAGRRRKKGEKTNPNTVPSGEQPETD